MSKQGTLGVKVLFLSLSLSLYFAFSQSIALPRVQTHTLLLSHALRLITQLFVHSLDKIYMYKPLSGGACRFSSTGVYLDCTLVEW